MYKLLDIVLFVLLIQVSNFGFIGYLCMRELLGAFNRYRKEGIVTSLGFEYVNENKEILYKDIHNIIGGYERSPIFPNTIVIDVDTGDKVQSLCLDDAQIAKLVGTQLNDITISTIWDIDKNLISILPSLSNELHVLYDPVGKYALAPYMPNLGGFIVFALSVGILAIPSNGNYSSVLGFILPLAIFAAACFIPPFYKQISVIIDSRGILLKDKNEEHFLLYEKIDKVENQLFRNKIVIKDKIYYFPKACYLLPELVVELKKQSASKGNQIVGKS